MTFPVNLIPPPLQMLLAMNEQYNNNTIAQASSLTVSLMPFTVTNGEVHVAPLSFLGPDHPSPGELIV